MKDRQKRTAALAAFSILAAVSGIWGGAAAGNRESLVGICGYERRFANQEDAFAQSLQEKAIEAQYQKAEVKEGVVVYSTQTASGCVPVTDSSGEVAGEVIWDAGWYVVNGAVSISEPITVNGDVNLILADGCDLNAKKGIAVTTGNSLTIYAQSEGSGKLTATGTAGSAPDSEKNASAGIGGSVTSVNSGDITIHGGVIHAAGGTSDWNGAAGIGGGAAKVEDGGSSGTIIIYGGVITANSGGSNSGAGIGGGGSGQNGGIGSNITIYGGSVTAVSTGFNAGGAGIGGGGGNENGGVGSNIQISGGMVKATGGEAGAGIGGGSGSGENKSGVALASRSVEAK